MKDPAPAASRSPSAWPIRSAQEPRAALVDLLDGLTGDDEPTTWLRRTSTRWLMADQTLESVGGALEDLPAVLIKGCAVGPLDYPVRELRDLTDVDVLVHADDLESARSRLERDGWSLMTPDTPEARDYRRRHGYCLQLRRPGALPLEVHYRLWGSLPECAATDVIAAARTMAGDRDLKPPAADTASSLLAPIRAHRYLLAAVHGWMSARTGPLRWWDLEWILRGLESDEALQELVEAVVAGAERWQAQLPVLLAARQCAAHFQSPRHQLIADLLRPSLRRTERFLLQHEERFVPTHTLVETARWTARRSSRGGLAAVLRRFWPHPYLVQQVTPQTWPPWRRRLGAQQRQLSFLIHSVRSVTRSALQR